MMMFQTVHGLWSINDLLSFPGEEITGLSDPFEDAEVTDSNGNSVKKADLNDLKKDDEALKVKQQRDIDLSAVVTSQERRALMDKTIGVSAGVWAWSDADLARIEMIKQKQISIAKEALLKISEIDATR